MYEDHNPAVCEILKDYGSSESEVLDELKAAARNSGKSIAELAVDAGVMERGELLAAIADFLHCDYLETAPSAISGATLALVPARLARMYAVVPIDENGRILRLIAKDPFNSQIVDDLTFSLDRDIDVLVCDPDWVDGLLVECYGEEEISIEGVLSEVDSGVLDDAGDEKDLSDSDIEALANDTPIIRFVNLVLTQAINDRASDIHFEPFDDEFRIRYRIDGALYEMAPPPRSLAVPVISRIKVLSNLNIAERRVPQDGRIKITLGGRAVDLRVSTLPTQYGESVVLRVLDKSVVHLDLDELGMREEVVSAVRKIASRPNGIFIATGPTGSGKTTTLYSALREINRPEQKIITAEDPVEYEIDGIMQVSVNHHIGFSFAKALRSFLRQDPDKIMIGEIRDLETARIAVQASLTGHLVMSTLHTNDAAGGITRLMDMGLEPYLISAALEAILAQRLVRRVCGSCRSEFLPTEELVKRMEGNLAEFGDRRYAYGTGCEGCNRTGYSGRLGLYELLTVSDAIRDMITESVPTLEIKRGAMEAGMRTLREDGIRAVHGGSTTIEEVLRYT